MRSKMAIREINAINRFLFVSDKRKGDNEGAGSGTGWSQAGARQQLFRGRNI
ncbi:MAG: hypothetical protein OP8BY_0409 [Candidatus Saccharicenans subterraneus]|uniref:Uncharacterized protein n=1 Tax=Candidatus Saccharicenans subterraneus TaxID=2508984 RepID=A0A3E2BKM7_9BACT|nr:MAG: hypothetical protein OP8BY_0409 [Candidatus Saccharicenans subterraneum]